MSTTAIENPMNAAHNHAANAEEHTNNGLIVLAMEEHYKAAKAYMASIERSQDESAKRTLRMLYNEQLKAGKDLQRRIEKLKEEGKDPSLPQPMKQKLHANPNVHSPQASSTPRNTIPVQRTMHPSTVPNRIESPQPMQRMSDTVDESFMLLGGQRSEPGDQFNSWWGKMQTVLDNLDRDPINLLAAFASTPLGQPEGEGTPTQGTKTPPATAQNRRDPSHSSDILLDGTLLGRLSRRLGVSRESSNEQQSEVHTALDDEDFTLSDEGDEDLAESFLVIPSSDKPSVLKKENAALKLEMIHMQKRLEAADKVLLQRREYEQQLRDSIYQAQRAMGASMLQRNTPDLSHLSLNPPPTPKPVVIPNRETEYLQRIKELETEIRQARAENERNKAMITKYREKWEKLKESSRKKKEAKFAAELAASPVRQRIVEEPEAEEALDNTC